MPSGYYARQRHAEPPRTASGYRGVIFCPNLTRKPWKAYIRQHGQYVTIGYFSTAQQAARAYNRESLRIKGPETYFNPLRPLSVR